ncbi:aromatic amino acid ammonia-lyase [Streptomyces bobili]|uniref:aromatic amino acid ammonia-lyase n=1 Tax=Streptomyces bobili TaxID=67280 RepID=UPI0037A4CCA4
MDTTPPRVVLNGTTLTVGELITLVDGAAVPEVAPEAHERAVRSFRAGRRLAAAGRLYGRGTGVGAHRAVSVDADDERAHGLRVLRSHAGGAGALLPARQVRAMLAVRANQLLAGGSGIHPGFIDALTEALRLGVHPAVNEYGAVGTGDLTALAQTGLTLLGERPWADSELGGRMGPVGPVGLSGSTGSAGLGTAAAPAPPEAAAAPEVRDSGVGADVAAVLDGIPARTGTPPLGAPARTSLPAPVTLRPGDALALLSSNALALGQASLGLHEVDRLLRATHAVAALALAAVSGSAEAYAAPVHALRPYPGAVRAAGEVRRLLGLPDRPENSGRRIQDPYKFRAFPQVHGCALDAVERLCEVVEAEINCPSENPLLALDGTAAYHHGGFFAAPLGHALETVNLTLLQTAQLSAARLTALGDPALTGLPAFLAAGPASSSGTMILEYTAHSALAELRSCAAPASVGHAVLSRGLEEAASFAGQAARQTLRAAEAYRTVLACELVSAVRALRMHAVPPQIAVFTVADEALPDGTDDRPLTGDVTAAAELLRFLAQF